jgi:putative ATP-dependent endonuclease of OLD family
LLSKILVFVEGLTDEYILKSYLDKKMLSSEFGFILMNGVGNYRYNSNANSLELLSSRGLHTAFLVDNDSMNKKDIEKVIKNHPQFSKVYTISGRCIENLFLDPETILHFIQEKLTKSNSKLELPNKFKIENDLKSVIQSLYPETIKLYLKWEYMKPIYPKPVDIDICSSETAATSVREGIVNIKRMAEEIMENFDESFEKYLESVNKSWEDNKEIMVSGDKVLDEICKLYNLRYKKSKEETELLSAVALE